MLDFQIPRLPWATHWNVVFIGVAFLVMQLFLTLRFWRRMKRHLRRLNRLLAELDAGGDGRDIQAHVGEIPWLKWVDRNFSRQATAPGNYTRDEVLRELDTQIASDSSYLLLQRTGVMAPLLGVIITVLGFMLIDFSRTGEQSLGELLLIVAPLVAGVGTGALLAFINQWLLHLVGGKVESVRYAARVWFDAAIWSHVGLDTQAATVKAIQAMEKMSRAVSEAAERETENARAMREGTASIRVAAADFQETHAVLNEQFRGMPGRLAELTASLEYAVDTLDALIPVGQRAATGLDSAATAFRTAVDERFVAAAKTHQTTIDTLAESVARINESTLQLRVGSGDLQETVNAHANTFKTLNRSLTNQVLPAHESFLAALSQFNGRAEGLFERMDSLQGELVQSLERIAALGPEADRGAACFTAATSAFADAVQHKFAPAAAEHQATMARLTASASQLQQAGQGLADGEQAIGGLMRLYARSSEELAASQQTLRTAVEGLAGASAGLQQTYGGDLAPAQRALQQAVDGFSRSAHCLQDFLADGLAPVAQQLAQLDQTFQSLSQTVAAIRELSAAREDIDRLVAALGQSATIAEAISRLPEQIRHILERSAPPRRGLTDWFRGLRNQET